jgi:hypothetical protein
MRYSKRALLVFGAGAALGLVVVSVELPGLGRIASLTMAVGIVLLPLALFADWRRYRLEPRRTTRKGQGKTRAKKRQRPSPRPRGRAKR